MIVRQMLIVFLVILTDADPDGAHKETFISLLSQKELIKEGPMTLALWGNEDAEIVSVLSLNQYWTCLSGSSAAFQFQSSILSRCSADEAHSGT